MDWRLRVGVAACNVGQFEVARRLWADEPTYASLAKRLRSLDSPTHEASTLQSIATAHPTLSTNDEGESGVSLYLDGDTVTPVDLDQQTLVRTMQALAPDPLEASTLTWLEDLSAPDDVSADRIRLLLIDAIFAPDRRRVAIDRLNRIAARERRKDRDIAGLFDE